MFGTEHKDHKFEHLEKIYDQHLGNIKGEYDIIRKKLVEYIKAMDEVRIPITNLQREKDKKKESAT